MLHLVRVNELYTTWPLTSDLVRQARDEYEQFYHLFSLLAPGHLTYKVHCMLHLPTQVVKQLGHPMGYWQYGVERYIGHLQQFRFSSHANLEKQIRK